MVSSAFVDLSSLSLSECYSDLSHLRLLSYPHSIYSSSSPSSITLQSSSERLLFGTKKSMMREYQYAHPEIDSLCFFKKWKR
ncbi:hypothetical protein BY996DRAFT_6483268, partial [Phakopsora pachyrhizi]